jgi:opacity protein-like surface antigen
MPRKFRKSAPLLAVSGLLLALAVTPAPAAANDSGGTGPSWGVSVRGGHYGVPDWILGLLFEEHPSVDGTMIGGELRFYGNGGPSGVFSVGLTLDVGSTDGFGLWQENSDDIPVVGGGAVDIVAGTVTAYWDIKPSSPLHPYVGLGLGIGYAEGTYDREGEEVKVEEFVPVIHIPVGLIWNLSPRFGIGVEGRVIDGISWGGILQLRF